MQKRRDSLSFGGFPTAEACCKELQCRDLATGTSRDIPSEFNAWIALSRESAGQRTGRSANAARKGR